MNRTRTRIILAALVIIVVAVVVSRLVRSGGESEEVVPNMAVHVGRITRASLRRFVSAYGSVQPEPATPGRPAAFSEVASPVAGVLARASCVEGQKVARGDVLFVLDSRLAEAAVERAKKNLVYAEQTFDRQKKLLAADGTSQKTYLEAESQLSAARSDLREAETGLALVNIQAPLSGRVVKIDRQPGESVELNTVLATIIDLDRLVVALGVPRLEADEVKVGQPAEIDVETAPSGRVVFVGSSVDEKADTVPVRVSIPPGRGYLPGRFLSVRIVTQEHTDRLVIPVVALIANTLVGDTGEIVLVEGEKAVRQPVKIGIREGALVEVEAAGLKEGQAIVTEDAYAVPDGTRVHTITNANE
jgi:membrane fusion protein (multidrug efflux system)